jgi:phosphoribosylaminoimidazole-succinocarboxamide synthase
MTTSLADLKHHSSGKVREIYEDGGELIMVASDRISVYDVILPTEIPDKGKVLTQMSLFWFELTGEIVPNHFISEDVPPRPRTRDGVRSSRCTDRVSSGLSLGSGLAQYQETRRSAGSSSRRA